METSWLLVCYTVAGVTTGLGMAGRYWGRGRGREDGRYDGYRYHRFLIRNDRCLLPLPITLLYLSLVTKLHGSARVVCHLGSVLCFCFLKDKMSLFIVDFKVCKVSVEREREGGERLFSLGFFFRMLPTSTVRIQIYLLEANQLFALTKSCSSSA